MARITRSSIILWMQSLLGIQGGSDAVPQYLTSQVVPVVDIQPKITTVIKNALSTSASAVTLYTTPSDKDFFLTYAQLAYSKAVDVATTNVSLTIIQDGATKTILYMPFQTLTAGQDQTGLNFSYPIKCDRNTVIQITNATVTAGTLNKSGSIGGFILE